MADDGANATRLMNFTEAKWRPDILAAYIEKGTGKLKFEIYEVPSGGQTPSEMVEKMKKIQAEILAAFPGSMEEIVEATHVIPMGAP